MEKGPPIRELSFPLVHQQSACWLNTSSSVPPPHPLYSTGWKTPLSLFIHFPTTGILRQAAEECGWYIEHDVVGGWNPGQARCELVHWCPGRADAQTNWEHGVYKVNMNFPDG